MASAASLISRSRRAASMFGVLLGAAMLALGGGFAWFVAVVHRPGPPLPPADGIVALTGGADRIETALHLFAAGRAPLLLVSGVARGAGLSGLTRRADLDPAPLAARVTLGRDATSTLGNAEETAAWARTHNIHSLIVVTAGYHMPRALLEMERTMPGVTLYPAPVQPPGMHRVSTLRLLASEYLKLLAAAVGMSRLMPHHHSAHPVDKSVD